MIIPTVIAFNNFSLGPVALPCIIQEAHEASLEITDYPVESGANVSDHAFRNPKRLTLEIAAADAAVVWNALVLFQESRIPFYMVSGLTIYSNMLIERLVANRDIDSSTILRGRVDLKEVIIASTATVPVDGQNVGTTPQGTPGGANSTEAANPTAEIAPTTTGSATSQMGDTTTQGVDAAADAVQDDSSYLYDLINQ